MNEKQSSLTIPIALVICVLVIIGAFYYQSQNPSSKNDNDKANSSLQSKLDQLVPVAENMDITKFRQVDKTDKILGSADAPIKLVVYTDLECPACKYYHTQLKAIESTYVTSGKVAIIYRDFPLDSLHSKARTEFLAAECVNEAGGNDKFWQFIDKIFEITPSNNGLDLAKLGETAKALGVDTKTFDACMASQKYASQIQKSVDEAIALGAPGTPSSVLIDEASNLTPMAVALPAERLSAIFDLLLKGPDESTN